MGGPVSSGRKFWLAVGVTVITKLFRRSKLLFGFPKTSVPAGANLPR